ncbi:MAG: hypothetical protein VW405_08645 [Rhodospirillaceae bacterium]
MRPPNAGKGRAKGVPNKVTGEVRAMLLEALDRAGGADYLLQQAQANPSSFMALVGKCLPTKLEGDAEAPVTIVVKRPW